MSFLRVSNVQIVYNYNLWTFDIVWTVWFYIIIDPFPFQFVHSAQMLLQKFSWHETVPTILEAFAWWRYAFNVSISIFLASFNRIIQLQLKSYYFQSGTYRFQIVMLVQLCNLIDMTAVIHMEFLSFYIFLLIGQKQSWKTKFSLLQSYTHIAQVNTYINLKTVISQVIGICVLMFHNTSNTTNKCWYFSTKI